MTSLLEEIRSISEDAASALERAGYTDCDIKSLTRIDLNELLPGLEKLRERKNVFEKIQKATKIEATFEKQRPIAVILKELMAFIPDEQLREALTGCGAPVEYLNALKQMKGHVNQIQAFLDAHIHRLEGGEETGNPDKAHPPLMPNSNMHKCTIVTVMSKVVVSGKTLDAHQHVLKQLREDFVQGHDLFRIHLEEKNDFENYQVVIVFCPVVSRLESDLESAMSQIRDDKNIILVLMHHSHEVKTSWSLRSWSKPKQVVLDVNVFFHDTVGGLLTCKENNDAVSEIQRKLLKYPSHKQEIDISPTPSFQSTNFFQKMVTKSSR